MTQAKQPTTEYLPQLDDDNMLPEYHLSGNGVRGKFAQTFRENGYSVTIRSKDGTSSTRQVSSQDVIEQQNQREQMKQEESSFTAVEKAIEAVVENPAVGIIVAGVKGFIDAEG